MRPPAPLRGLDIQVAEDIDEALAAAARSGAEPELVPATAKTPDTAAG